MKVTGMELVSIEKKHTDKADGSETTVYTAKFEKGNTTVTIKDQQNDFSDLTVGLSGYEIELKNKQKTLD